MPGFLFTRDYGVLCSTSRHCTWIECRCRYCYCAGFYTITMDRMASITGNQLCVQGVRCVECLSKHDFHKLPGGADDTGYRGCHSNGDRPANTRHLKPTRTPIWPARVSVWIRHTTRRGAPHDHSHCVILPRHTYAAFQSSLVFGYFSAALWWLKI